MLNYETFLSALGRTKKLKSDYYDSEDEEDEEFGEGEIEDVLPIHKPSILRQSVR